MTEAVRINSYEYTHDAVGYQRMLSCAFLFLVLVARAAIYMFDHGLPYIKDDAFYYIVIATHISETGVSTFDQNSLTNGYHPLWMMMLVVWIYIFGKSIMMIKILEALILSAALYNLLKLINSRNIIMNIFVLGCFEYAVSSVSNMGMETTPLLLIYTIFIRVLYSERPEIANHRGLFSGLLGALCIASRIDAAVFIVPMLLIVLRSLQERTTSLGILGVLGGLYAAVNWVMFGSALPISGEIKSLGGFQVNEHLIAQMKNFTFKDILKGRHYWTVILAFSASLPILLSLKINVRTNTIVASIFAGFLIYNVKLFLFSSWQVWDWYLYPLYFMMVPALLSLEEIIGRRARHIKDSVKNVQKISGEVFVLGSTAVIMAFVYPIYSLVKIYGSNHQNFHYVNRHVATDYADVLGNALVAMGDRAGSFAYYYKGSVFQLEGLVGDASYFSVIRKAGDITGELCRRKVKYVVDYEIDLGDYTNHTIDVIRPNLTSYPGPKIQVSRSDEVIKYADLRKYDNRSEDEGDNYVYVWRLACSA